MSPLSAGKPCCGIAEAVERSLVHEMLDAGFTMISQPVDHVAVLRLAVPLPHAAGLNSKRTSWTSSTAFTGPDKTSKFQGLVHRGSPMQMHIKRVA